MCSHATLFHIQIMFRVVVVLCMSGCVYQEDYCFVHTQCLMTVCLGSVKSWYEWHYVPHPLTKFVTNSEVYFCRLLSLIHFFASFAAFIKLGG